MYVSIFIAVISISAIILLAVYMRQAQQQQWRQAQESFDSRQIQSMQLIQDSLNQALRSSRDEVTNSLIQQSNHLNQAMLQLNQNTQQQMLQMQNTMDNALNKGFEKTNDTFTHVIKRLGIIDAAQQKISDLSTEVVSLQQLLNDKRSRGAFGEVQLETLVRNMIPESHFAMQHTLSNGKRVDCILFLPKPTGNIAIDAKFPLENYQKSIDDTIDDASKKQALAQFKLDLRKHIKDISNKYIIEGETADGAIMFIPAEAIFAHIHAHLPDCISEAHKHHVWLTSPTTLMAILTTTKAVIKDDATKEQVHIIQKHLIALSKDFERFDDRMQLLSKHIKQVGVDVDLVQTSSSKIISKFKKIESAEMVHLTEPHQEENFSE
jgi:DNA recombination protein RmuC